MNCVIVLGLPRGGTSATAGVLHALGVNMGDELMPAFHANPKGFFEDMAFVDLHNRIMGGRDKDPREEYVAPPADPVWQDYTDLIAERSTRPLWGVKDPKLAFVLPQFFARAKRGIKIVLVTRRFHDTVRSYERLWGGVSRQEAVRRLGNYQYALSKNLEPFPSGAVHKVSYEVLCRLPETTVRGLAEFVGVEYRAEAARFVDPALNRNGNLRNVGVTVVGV